MTERYITDNPELDALFERYRQAPRSHVFAPLADACRKAGLIDEAVDIADRGVQENPGYTSGHVVRGKCYYDRGDRKTAVACFERVLDLDPNNLVALKFLGLIQAEEGDAAGARERFKHILALDPDDREIRRELDILDVPAKPVPDAHEETAETVERVETVEAVGPMETLAETEAQETREVKAADDGFEGAPISLGTDDDPTTDELATMTLADIYAEQGYADKALRIYREVLKRQPGNSGIREKIRALDPDAEVDEPAGSADAHSAPVAEPAEPFEVAAPEASEHFDDAPAMEMTEDVDEPVEVLEHAPVAGPIEVADEETPSDDPTFPPPPGVAIELPPPEDMDTGEAPEPDTEDDSGRDAPHFEEFAAPAETVPAKAKAEPPADDDPNNPLPYQRRDGTIDEGRSYEQFKRWLKNLAD
jgi:tetratricopeptide (TPR) repeat protein